MPVLHFGPPASSTFKQASGMHLHCFKLIAFPGAHFGLPVPAHSFSHDSEGSHWQVSVLNTAGALQLGSEVNRQAQELVEAKRASTAKDMKNLLKDIVSPFLATVQTP